MPAETSAAALSSSVGPVGLAFEFGLERGGCGEPVAQQREVARASASGGEPRRAPGRSRAWLSALSADALAADRVFVRARRPAPSRASIAARSVSGAEISSASKRRPGGGLAAVDLAEQASGNASRDRAAQLEAVAGRGVDRHVRSSAAIRRGASSRVAGALLGRVEIGEQPARRGQLGARRRAEPVERRQPEPRLERALARQAVEPALAGGGGDARDGSVGDRLGRRQPRELGGQLARRRRRPARTGRSKCRRRRSPSPRRPRRPPRASWPTRIRARSPRSACRA